MTTRWIAAAATTLVGLVLLGIVLLTTEFHDIPPYSPLVLLVDADIREIARMSDSSPVRFEIRPQDGTKAALDKVSFKPANWTTAVARIQSAMLSRKMYALESTSSKDCSPANLADQCNVIFKAIDSEVHIQRQTDMLVISKFVLR